MIRTIQFILLVLGVAFLGTSFAQTNITTSLKPKPKQELSFFEIQKSFNDYWEPKNVDNGYFIENGIKKKAYGWKQFKRWEYYWSTRVNPTTGTFPNTGAADFYTKRGNTSGDRNATGSWTSMGPTTASGGYHGLGRLNCVSFRTGDNNTLYVGAPSGGMWKTTDGGTTWTVLTDDNDVLGVSDAIVIAGMTTDSDTVYIGTGDRDGGSMWTLGGGQWHDNNSIGVLKSTDGGTTWSSTGLTFTASQKTTINRMLLDPNDNSILYAATSNGLYKTTDAGVAWSSIYAEHFVDIKFKPGNSQIIYGSTRYGKIYVSTNSGTTWTNSLDVSASSVKRIDIAVSSDEPTWVYAVAVDSIRGLSGVYKSTDSGLNYSLIYDGSIANQNLLCSDCNANASGGQGTYDLAIAVDPIDANKLFIGGVNTWYSSDGGISWTISNMWWGNCSGVAVEVHADKHFLAYQNGTSTLFECNDGGLYKTTDDGDNWNHIGNGLEISQLYRLGVSQTSSSSVIAGLQDNGTKAKLSGVWNDVIGGDGMDCMIDYTDANTQYGESQGGNLKRTTDSWASTSSITTGLSGDKYWVMPIAIDPNVHTTIYAGTNDVFKSTDKGTTWTKISNWAGSTLKELAVAPSNSNYIYTTTQSILYRTTDGGASWSDITGTLPVGSTSITYIAIKDDDPNTVWVSMGQYNTDGVYETTNGGATWANISTGLPSIPVMCIVQNTQNTTQTELYAGTDVGIYVKIDGGAWALYSDGLPNVVVNELKIYYNSTTPNLSRIRAATSGRGMWESELYSPPNQAPIADFAADITEPGVSQTVTFSDLSTNVPTSWQWSFTPSTVTYVGGTTANSQNPQVQFTSEGDYTAQLIATNAFGSNTESKTDYISVASLLTYCTANGGGIIYLSGVQIGTINNIGTGDEGYSDYTSMSTDLMVNTLNDITITYGLVTDNSSDLGIWIDWNKDGDFDDTDENVTCIVDISDNQEIYSIFVPDDALVGVTTMRIRMKIMWDDCGNSCGATNYGEVEDYKINVLAGTNNWLGNTSEWNSIANWSDGVVPTASYKVIIPTGVTSPVIAAGTNAKCYNITLETGATITVNGNLGVEK